LVATPASKKQIDYKKKKKIKKKWKTYAKIILTPVLKII
jgi:hypothetical protein